MEYFHLKDTFSFEDIQSLIDSEAEESTYLEFKSAGALDKTDKKKDEIAKDISAFANSDGGLLIYGIDEINHKAKEVSFINGIIYTKEWLENVISSKIQRPVRSLKIFPIRINNDIEQSIYVVKISPSKEIPHQASGKFFRRANFAVYTMQEYEIRNMYNLRQKTELNILDIKKCNFDVQNSQKVRPDFYPVISIKNISESIEFHYKIEIGITPSIHIEMNSPINKYENGYIDNLKIFSIPNDSPLYQNEIKTYNNFIWLKINRQSFVSFQDAILKIRLYYSNGIVEKEFLFNDYFLINNRKITIDDLL